MLNWNDIVNMRDGTHTTLEDFIKSLGEAGLERRVQNLENNAYLGGDLSVDGTITSSGDASLGGGLTVTGNISTVWGKIESNGDGIAPTEPI
jgi:hypothetical protein